MTFWLSLKAIAMAYLQCCMSPVQCHFLLTQVWNGQDALISCKLTLLLLSFLLKYELQQELTLAFPARVQQQLKQA